MRQWPPSAFPVEITATLRIEYDKGNTKRVVPLTQSAIAALKLYLEEARSLFAREAGQVRLFVSSRSGGPLDDDDIVRIRKAANRAGLSKHVTPAHAASHLRHSPIERPR